MGTSEGRPGWQVDACPPWCVVMHEGGDHDSDRRHVSASLSVPAVQRPTGTAEQPTLFGEDGAGPDGARPVDLAVCLHRRDGGATTWLYVGDGERQALELCVDSWRRLVPAVDRALDVARG